MNSQPNILLILTDQQRFDTVSAYGQQSFARTPYLDTLAEEGICYTSAFTPSSVCAPARGTLFTGLYPHQHGVTTNSSTLKPGIRGLTDYLLEAGYECGYAGKWHIDDTQGPSQFGFRAKDFVGYAYPGCGVIPDLAFDLPPKTGNPYAEYLEEQKLPVPEIADAFQGNNPSNQVQEMYARHVGPLESTIEYFVAVEAMRIMDEMAASVKPFFLWVNFWGPHTPCILPEPYFSMIDPKDIPEHPSYCETFEGKPYRQQLIERLWGLGDFGWEAFQEIGARYFGYCVFIDDLCRRITDHLRQLGAFDDTVIIYGTDHGDCMGAHKLIEKGEFMYDETYRIPLIVRHPECSKPGTKNDDLVMLHDLTSSILAMAGVEVPPGMNGFSLLPSMLGGDNEMKRDEIFCVLHRHFTTVEQRMVRTRKHQLTFNSGDQGELYDLVKDPCQLSNVYRNPAYDSVRRELMVHMERHLRTLDDPLLAWFSRIKAVY